MNNSNDTGRAKTILVVDDELDHLETLDILLRIEGYEVLKATNGRDGLKKLEEQRPDLILTDLMMPVMSGVEMLETLQNMPHKSVPTILMSAGLAHQRYLNKNLWTVFMKKPLEIEKLYATIARILDDRNESSSREPTS